MCMTGCESECRGNKQDCLKCLRHGCVKIPCEVFKNGNGGLMFVTLSFKSR